ncbi:putative E3 ubiquitin-protein ligase LIN-1 isoform X2 [Tripterygium wilfordii]|uniref:putative E3 ubiquitin-protein ligase LIN-1 isoform X2 n=1 Tax=Tripterygium wilfordii TaxID=458696 RepID=UPI0018F85DEE|nr:putative E3 ubiquitin-protein ligase LIN-1 isoform X2 [Tripterygium wilfordii]
MAENYRFPMDQKDIVRVLVTTVESFVQDRLINKEQRTQHKEQCAERLAAEDGSYDKDVEVRYSDQAVLANLDWGIEALEEAINTPNMETKLAQLDYAQKMLHVCAMLNSNQKTAGVPNYYLSAWAHLNLSYMWKLHNNVNNSVLHILEMFIVDPFFSRIDFAPELWRDLFLPHMSSIVGWYSEERHRLMMDLIPDSSDLSFTADLDQFFNESSILSMRPDQLEKLQKLEQLYGESLDENTRLFAKHYKDCMTSDSGISRKVIPMLPIAEPPMTPLHEVSRSIPDYVKFGPILPKSAGFSPVLQSKHGAKEASRRNKTSTLSQNLEEYAIWDPQVRLLEENEGDSDYERDDAYMDSEDTSHALIALSKVKMTENQESGSKGQLSKINSQTHSPTIISPKSKSRAHSPAIISPKTKSQTHSSAGISPLDSPKTPCQNSSMYADMHSRKEPSVLRLSSTRVNDFTIASSLPISPCASHDGRISPGDSDGEVNKSCLRSHGRTRSMSYDNVNSQVVENSIVVLSSPFNDSDEGSQSCISLPLSEKSTSRSRPPKDFVCPITSQIFNDPVTLETGQTYERKAIQEWIKRGNTTCPITRQPLLSSTLPKTNYVLKRLITSWKDQYPDLAQEFSYSETAMNSLSPSSARESPVLSPLSKKFDFSSKKSTDAYNNYRNKRFVRAVVATSPTSVISQAAVETIISGLNPHVSCICTSENLQECEAAVLAMARLWKESKADPAVHSYLSKPTIINGFVEILSASLSREVLRTSIYILSELMFADEGIGETLTSVDTDFECLAALLKNGLAEAAVLIYQLRPAFAQLSSHELVPSLVHIILSKNEDLNGLQFLVEPKDAAIVLLEQILMGGDENSRSLNATCVISANGIPSLVNSLDREEVRRSIVSIMLCCMHANKSCRNFIARRIELSPVLELFHDGDDSMRAVCINFLVELVQLNRRTFSNQILQMIKDEGAVSTMHSFLVYLQMAPMEQQPSIATLLLQLDLLVEPRKMSIYREDAVEALIEALRRKDFSNCQKMALDALLSLSGYLTSSGKVYTEAWLLKLAGFDQPYNALMKAEELIKLDYDSLETTEDEEKAASSWERRAAFVLCNYEKGSIFKALEECFKSNSLEIAKSCLVIATWLTYMLSLLPDTGVRHAARKYLLDEFINVLQSSKNLEEKILATLALKTFIGDPAALEEMGKYAKCIYKTLRKLKRHSIVVPDILKALMNLSSIDAMELWSSTEVVELELYANGEVLSLLHLKGRFLSGHSDGTIKVWDSGKRAPRLIQEVHEHKKAVTCLYVTSSGDKLYSGSLDKTIRVWAIKPEAIHCVQVHDVKEPVHDLTANAKVACFISRGTGVKVYNWSGAPKHVNFNKYVKCLAMVGDKLYCGCSGYNIQEVDLCNYTWKIFYSGTRKLLGKQSIHALHVHDGLLFAGGSTVDGTAGRTFSLSTMEITGSFSTGFDIQRITANNDFIFTATKCGVIEVWLKERVTRIGAIKVGAGGHSRITSMATDQDGGMLYAGSSDGKIQAWSLD